MALARCEEYLQIIVGEILCSKVMVAVETLRGLRVFALAGFGSSLPVVSISPLITSVKSGRKTRVKVSNSSYKQLRPAIIEVRQQTLEDDGREIVALLLKGRFSGAGVTQEASGELIKLPEEDCIDSYEDFVKQFTSSWIGVISIGSSSSQSSSSNEDPESDRNTTDRYTVLEKVKKAMMLGASAIIILVLNPKILQELDVAQILIKPLVLVEDSDNITVLLNALRSKMKLRLRVTSGSISIYDTQTFTVWSACWRARPGSGVVCKSDNRLSKADPSLFWSYFYSAIAVVILLLLLKTNHRNENEENHEDSQTVHTIARMALSLLKTRRYKDKTYWSSESKHGDERDSCAICLDIFHRRQILRVLPCLHEFHSKCVDQWLLCHQTCPLCKSNIVEFQINEGLISRRLSSRFS